MPIGVSAAFVLIEIMSYYAAIGVIIGLITIGVILMIYFHKHPIETKDENDPLINRAWFDMLLSLLWKVSFIVSYTYINFQIYFYNLSLGNLYTYTNSNLLLLSSLLSSGFLESINFFEKEKGHFYPSLRRILTLNQQLFSARQEDQYKNKVKLRLFLIIFISTQIVLSLIFLLYSYSLVIFSVFILLLELLLKILGIELKYKVWNYGEQVITNYNFFLWICIYAPYISFIIPESIISNSGENIVWTSVIAAIVCFCIFSSIILGKMYKKFMDISMWQMINAAKSRNYDKNMSKLIAEAAIDDIKLLENESDEKILSDRSLLCKICETQEHDIIPDENSEHDSAVLAFLLLKNAEFNPRSSTKVMTDKQTIDSSRINIQDNSIINHRNDLKILFNVGENNMVYKIIFIDVVRERFSKLSRHILAMAFIKIGNSRLKQFKQDFNDEFIKRTLYVLAEIVYKYNSPERCNEILNRLLMIAPINIVKVKETLLKNIIKLALGAENAADNFIPNHILPPPFDYTNKRLYQILNELKENHSNNCESIIDKAINTTKSILMGGFFETYALASLALSDEMNWLDSKLSLTVFPLVSQSSWILSLAFNFAFCFVFILSSLICLLLIKKVYTTVKS